MLQMIRENNHNRKLILDLVGLVTPPLIASFCTLYKRPQNLTQPSFLIHGLFGLSQSVQKKAIRDGVTKPTRFLIFVYCSYFSNLVYIHIYLIILCLSIYLSVCVSSNACISLFLTIWLSSIYMPVSSFICLFIFICFVYLYRCPSTCLYIP